MEKNLTDPYVRLNYSWDMILCINDFISCIGLHKKDLKSSRNVNFMNYMKDFFHNEDFNPAGVLKDYIYLEANSFFEYAKNLKSKGDKNLPDLPDYLEILKNFRDVMVGHRDKKEKIEFPNGWIELQESTQRSIPVKELIKDVDKYYQEVIKRYRKDQQLSKIALPRDSSS